MCQNKPNCEVRGVVEDKYHFLLECARYEQQRAVLMRSLQINRSTVSAVMSKYLFLCKVIKIPRKMTMCIVFTRTTQLRLTKDNMREIYYVEQNNISKTQSQRAIYQISRTHKIHLHNKRFTYFVT